MQIRNENAKSRQNRAQNEIQNLRGQFQSALESFKQSTKTSTLHLKRGFAFILESDDSPYRAISIGGGGWDGLEGWEGGWFSTTPRGGALSTLVYPHLRHLMQSLVIFIKPRVFDTNPPPPTHRPKRRNVQSQLTRTYSNRSFIVYQLAISYNPIGLRKSTQST